MLFAIYANSQKQQQSNEIKLFSDNKLSSNNKYNDDLKNLFLKNHHFRLIKNYLTVLEMLYEKNFNNGELVGLKIGRQRGLNFVLSNQ
uniref:Uncharacterized protein n=1 Tax=Candidatus Phytoplasma australasiaticum subsp. australasiaticum TaxID=2832407 RepID=A0A7S7JMD2_9MOLU|nr:hypothetical protein H7685_00580 ['Parthenium hysterophorus' phyllody phytoplasma]